MADPPPVTGPSVAPAQVIREALGVLAFVENGEWVKRGDAALAALAVLEAEREVRGPVQPPLLQTFKELSWWATALANGERDDLSAFASHFASEVTVYARSSSSAVSSVANNTEQAGDDRSAFASDDVPSIREQHERIMAAIKTTGLKDGSAGEGWRDEEGREWEYRLIRAVECPVCCFTFGAEHTTPGKTNGWTDADGYECPVCEAARAEASLVAHREALREIALLLDQADLGHGDYWLGNLDRAKNVARAALAVDGREEEQADAGGTA